MSPAVDHSSSSGGGGFGASFARRLSRSKFVPEPEPSDEDDEPNEELDEAATEEFMTQENLLFDRPPEESRAIQGYDLSDAIFRDDLEAAKVAIKNGASVNIPVHDPEYGGFLTLLGKVCKDPKLKNAEPMMKLLIESDICVNGCGSRGETALMFCCHWKNVKFVSYLLGIQADPLVTGTDGLTALGYAARIVPEVPTVTPMAYARSAQLIRLLIMHKANVEVDKTRSLLEAVKSDNLLGAAALLEEGTWVYQSSFQLLSGLVGNGREERCETVPLCELLIAAMADTSARSQKEGKRSVLELCEEMVPDGADNHLYKLLEEGHKNFDCWEKGEEAIKEEVSNVKGQKKKLMENLRRKSEAIIAIKKRPKKHASKTSPESEVKDATDATETIESPRSSEGSEDEVDKKRIKSGVAHENLNIYTLIVRKIEGPCKRLNAESSFQLIMLFFLLMALFLPDIWVLTDSDPKRLDTILIIVMLMFAFEFGIQYYGVRGYVGTFFFYMDILGTISVFFDFSYFQELVESSGEGSQQLVVMRTARLAKLGARAGRFSKLVKLLRFLPGMHGMAEPEEGQRSTAKIISAQVNAAVSTRVALLIIVLLVTLPAGGMITMLDPEQDLSLKTWPGDMAFEYAARGMDDFLQTVENMKTFYTEQEADFHPFYVKVMELDAIDLNKYPDDTIGENAPAIYEIEFERPFTAPKSDRNTARRFADEGKFRVMTKYNFEEPKFLDAYMNIATIAFVIFALLGFSLLLSNVVSNMVLKPLENLLTQVRSTASTIFKSVTDMSTSMTSSDAKTSGDDDEDMDASDALSAETVILERVVEKLAIMSEIMMKKATIDAETMEMVRTSIIVTDGAGDDQSEASDDDSEALLQAQNERLKLVASGVNVEIVEGWNFNPHDFDLHQLTSVMMWFWYGNAETNTWIETTLKCDYERVRKFVDTVATGYVKENPYHSWFHACDVTHSVFLTMQEGRANDYFNVVEKFSLVLAAMCHDLAHPGLNNPFLVETSHDLALRYNDKSPLENMHCALLFQFAVQEDETAILRSLPKAIYSELRRNCVEAILHTDMVNHFAMVKDIQMMYEVNSEVMNRGHSPDAWPSESWQLPVALAQVFAQNDNRKLLKNMILHLSDISNSMKPFFICRHWAHRVLDEFFLQGDKEKDLGIPVQMLNDRNKVNRPFSQLGFIEFIVAPLVFAVARVVSPVGASAEQLVSNARQWQSEWVESGDPTEKEEIAVQKRLNTLEESYNDCVNTGKK